MESGVPRTEENAGTVLTQDLFSTVSSRHLVFGGFMFNIPKCRIHRRGGGNLERQTRGGNWYRRPDTVEEDDCFHLETATDFHYQRGPCDMQNPRMFVHILL